ncbi:MAG: hypothetical protein HN580_07445 [Deltaproteobacteria bacterium]|jgi:hypothetical protein|nr:hypothetical protein [Deltaproteobacteria bacterium]MBT4641897.1 hypothetical protein [Deltaproteobacteria bacterium]MBT6615544.1 hypothetical protein [Deltaproteobacteria bacterium]MBT7153853.1 hypothetical protein [Deltaproteobacteria bacterium]MBT7716632.1 hypothetical protein [Deltaproteobacteria bacterium]
MDTTDGKNARKNWRLMARISISPDEKKICFGHIEGCRFKEPGHAMRIANKEHNPGW